MIDVSGDWWLPEDKTKRLPGQLTWDWREGGELRLHGEFRPIPWEENKLPDGSVQMVRRGTMKPEEELTYPVIHGLADGRAYTLAHGLGGIGKRFLNTDQMNERVSVDEVFAGAWISDRDELEVVAAEVRMRNLTAWIAFEAARYSVAHESDDYGSLTTFKAPRYSVADGGRTTSLRQSVRISGDGIHDKSIRQEWSLHLRPDSSQPLQWFVDAASDAQDLVSIASAGTAEFQELTLHVLATSDYAESPAELRTINYEARWQRRADRRKPVRARDLIFTFEQFGGVDALGRWLIVAEMYRSELGRVMATQYNAGMYLEDMIMNVCAALDSFDAVRRNKHSRQIDYVERIRACIDWAPQPFKQLVPADTYAWEHEIKNVRHDIAHHRKNIRLDQSEAVTLENYTRLYWLFVFGILRCAKVPDQLYGEIVKHNKLSGLIDKSRP